MKTYYAALKSGKSTIDMIEHNRSANSAEAGLNRVNLNNSEFRNLFENNKDTIKQIEEKILALPKEKLQAENFNIEYSGFYLNINIDKSFEIFKEKIFPLNTIKSAFKANYEAYIQKFISRIIELDRMIYVSINL